MDEHSFLDAELLTAQRPVNYFIFDMRGKRIFLKARGIVLREWEIEGVMVMGDPVPIKPLIIMDKVSLNPPERIEVNPEQEQEPQQQQAPHQEQKPQQEQESQQEQKKKTGDFSLDAMEVEDMPYTYTLLLDQGIVIYIRHREGEGVSFLVNRALYFAKWYAVTPVLNFFKHRKGGPYTMIDLTLRNKQEAQALFWSILDKAECILHF